MKCKWNVSEMSNEYLYIITPIFDVLNYIKICKFYFIHSINILLVRKLYPFAGMSRYIKSH